MLQPYLEKNDKKAKRLIYTVSVVVFAAVVFLSKYKLNVDTGFDVHVFAKANAVINSLVAALLLAGLFTAIKA
jgi:putative membrane protein